MYYNLKPTQPDSLFNSNFDATARAKSRNNTTRLHDLEDQIDRLLLINRAMWELVRDKNGFTEDELFSKVAEIDLRDGKMDGKLSKDRKKCSSCGRTLNPKHTRCLYCGNEELVVDAFDAVK